MIDHNQIKELLAGFALGDLGPDQAKIVAEHITQCNSCKQKVESLQLVLDCADQISEVSVDENMCASAKETLFKNLQPEKIKTETVPAPTGHTTRWRTIMQSKVTRYAAAAVIILGTFLGLYALGISPDGSSVAWASLAQHVKQIKTVTYKMHMTMKGIPGTPKDKEMVMDQTIWNSSDFGMKMEMTMDGKVMSRIYMLFAEESMVTIMDEQKKFMRIILTDDIRDKMKKESYDPKQMVSGFMDVDYIDLGRKEIDGVEVEGVEVNDPKVAGGMFPQFIGRLWVDVKTDLPVLIEMEFGSDDGMEVKGVINNFDWGVELDESDFAYAIPADYEEMAEMKMPEMNADASIEGLKMLMQIYGGEFPKTLNMMDVISEASEHRRKLSKEKINARIKAIEDAVEAGIDPNTILNQKEDIQDMMQKRMNDQMKIQGLCMFYMQLVTEKKDPAYYGDRVSPSDTDMILMRWLNDKGGYTVIFADLSTGDFSAEEVGEMEAKLPEQIVE